jgi:hypothetical protein
VYSSGCKGQPVRYIDRNKGGRMAKSPCRFCRAIGTSIAIGYFFLGFVERAIALSTF